MIGEVLGAIAGRSLNMQWHHYLLFFALIAGGYALGRVWATPAQMVGLP